jgi:sulfide:quinone oxidoreductase
VTASPMAGSPYRVVIAGGGVAGLETLMGVRALVGDRAQVTMVAPDDEFVFRPLAVEEPFPVGRPRRVPLAAAAHQAGAEFLSTTVTAVDPGRRAATTSGGDQLDYDALVLAVGAEPMPAVAHALSWDDRADAEVLGGLLQDIEQGYNRRVAVIIPPGPGWPLRGYEIALWISLEGKGMGVDAEVTLVTPDPAPLMLLGDRAVDAVSRELDKAGVTVVAASHADVEPGRSPTVVLRPSAQRHEVDRVLALPVLRGRSIPGVPADADGFVDVDGHCRVRGLEGVWAAGDATSFPVKSGGLAAEQADAVAEDVAAAAGAPVEPTPFDPAVREEVGGLPAGRFLSTWLVADDEGLTTTLPGEGIPVLTYLQRDLAAGWRGYG